MFTNNYFGEADLLLGTKGTIVHDETDKPRYPAGRAKLSEASTGSTGERGGDRCACRTSTACAAGGPNCPFEIASAARSPARWPCAYREGRTVTWDEGGGSSELADLLGARRPMGSEGGEPMGTGTWRSSRPFRWRSRRAIAPRPRFSS
jgi:hypothetical protein